MITWDSHWMMVTVMNRIYSHLVDAKSIITGNYKVPFHSYHIFIHSIHAKGGYGGGGYGGHGGGHGGYGGGHHGGEHLNTRIMMLFEYIFLFIPLYMLIVFLWHSIYCTTLKIDLFSLKKHYIFHTTQS